MKLGSFWVVQWSAHQGSFDVQTLEDAVKTNIRALMHYTCADHVLLAVCKSHDEATVISRRMMILSGGVPGKQVPDV